MTTIILIALVAALSYAACALGYSHGWNDAVSGTLAAKLRDIQGSPLLASRRTDQAAE
jgi:hypothetical protein